MSPHTALRTALLSGRPAALVVRRPGGPVHVYAWHSAGTAPTAVGLRRGCRPVCGQRGKRWLLAATVTVDTPMCGRCDSRMRPLIPRRDIPEGMVPDAELPELIRSCRTARHHEWARIHILEPWRGLMKVTGLTGVQVTVMHLYAEVRQRLLILAADRRDAPMRARAAEAEGLR